MNNTFIWSPDELYHHGIKGQKWGIRRYQNADGTLTAEGKTHYGALSNKSLTRQLNKADRQTTKSFYRKKQYLQRSLESFQVGNKKRGEKLFDKYTDSMKNFARSGAKQKDLQELASGRSITKKVVDRRVNTGKAIALSLLAGSTLAGATYLSSKAAHYEWAHGRSVFMPVGAVPIALFGKNPFVAGGLGAVGAAGMYVGTLQKEKGYKYTANKKH